MSYSIFLTSICIIYYITTYSQLATTPSTIIQQESWLELYMTRRRGRGSLMEWTVHVCEHILFRGGGCCKPVRLCLPNLFIITNGVPVLFFLSSVATQNTHPYAFKPTLKHACRCIHNSTDWPNQQAHLSHLFTQVDMTPHPPTTAPTHPPQANEYHQT